MNISDIEPLADGRIMNGIMAKECRLVDEVGTFENSISKAREMANLSEHAPVYDEVKNPFQQIIMNLEGMFHGTSLMEKVATPDNIYRFEYRYMQ